MNWKNYRNKTLINRNTIKKTAKDICRIFKSQNVKSSKGRESVAGRGLLIPDVDAVKNGESISNDSETSL